MTRDKMAEPIRRHNLADLATDGTDDLRTQVAAWREDLTAIATEVEGSVSAATGAAADVRALNERLDKMAAFAALFRVGAGVLQVRLGEVTLSFEIYDNPDGRPDVSIALYTTDAD